MRRRGSPYVGAATRGIAVLGIATLVAAPVVPLDNPPPPPTAVTHPVVTHPVVTHNVHLAAVSVPPGGLLFSFLGNQVKYCAIICPLLVETGATAAVTTLQAPATFLNGLRSGNLLRAIGIAAASVTGPTNAAAQATILADGTRVAPRALNAFQVGVVGLLNVVPAAADGLPGIVRAIQTAREDTYTALNRPVVPNPTPTVQPRGVLQVAAVETINVVAAVIFPAFNHVLSAVFEVPDAIAQELAVSGDPIRALGAGLEAAADRLIAAGTAVVDAVVTAVRNIGGAVQDPPDVPATSPNREVAAASEPDEAVPPRTVADDRRGEIADDVDVGKSPSARDGTPPRPVTERTVNLRGDHAERLGDDAENEHDDGVAENVRTAREDDAARGDEEKPDRAEDDVAGDGDRNAAPAGGNGSVSAAKSGNRSSADATGNGDRVARSRGDQHNPSVAPSRAGSSHDADASQIS